MNISNSFRVLRYITEIAPASRRGMLVSIPQFMSATGICLGYFTCYASIKIDSSISWRLPFIFMAVTGIVLAVSCFYLPPSPRWLLVNGRRHDAMGSIDRLDIPRAEVEKDMSKLTARSEAQLSTWQATRAIFQKKYRLRTILGLFVLGMVQLSGIDGVLYVSLKLPISCLMACGFQSLAIANVLTPTVCSYPLLSSRPIKWHSLFPRIWCLRYPYVSNISPCFHLRR